MSSSLYWKPISHEAHHVNTELKYILEKRFIAMPAVLNHEHVSYLEGLKDAGVKGADELIEAIEKHEQIEISLRY